MVYMVISFKMSLCVYTRVCTSCVMMSIRWLLVYYHFMILNFRVKVWFLNNMVYSPLNHQYRLLFSFIWKTN